MVSSVNPLPPEERTRPAAITEATPKLACGRDPKLGPQCVSLVPVQPAAASILDKDKQGTISRVPASAIDAPSVKPLISIRGFLANKPVGGAVPLCGAISNRLRFGRVPLANDLVSIVGAFLSELAARPRLVVSCE
jgi:hypothetical protein